jgi:Na+-driven multidrug efflux pump
MPAVFLALPLTLLRVPAAIFAGSYLELGVIGIFWSLALTSIVRGLLMAFWFARNRWIDAKA